MKSHKILKQLIEDVNNPNMANGEAALRAASDAKAMFAEQGGTKETKSVVQEPEAGSEVSGPGEAGEAVAGDVQRVDEEHAGSPQAAGKSGKPAAGKKGAAKHG